MLGLTLLVTNEDILDEILLPTSNKDCISNSKI